MNTGYYFLAYNAKTIWRGIDTPFQPKSTHCFHEINNNLSAGKKNPIPANFHPIPRIHPSYTALKYNQWRGVLTDPHSSLFSVTSTQCRRKTVSHSASS
jgi:hypothetical protein